jgi:hypothetical protein
MPPSSWRPGLVLVVLLAAGCRGGDAAKAPAVPACTAAQAKAYLREVQVDADHEVAARLTVMNTGTRSCRSKGAPKVVIDSGLGPSPAVDGTAVAVEGYGPDDVIKPGAALAFPLAWGASGACGGNHQLPVVHVLVTLPGDRRALVIPASGVPRAARTFCWIDGLAIGPVD